MPGIEGEKRGRVRVRDRLVVHLGRAGEQNAVEEPQNSG